MDDGIGSRIDRILELLEATKPVLELRRKQELPRVLIKNAFIDDKNDLKVYLHGDKYLEVAVKGMNKGKQAVWECSQEDAFEILSLLDNHIRNFPQKEEGDGWNGGRSHDDYKYEHVRKLWNALPKEIHEIAHKNDDLYYEEKEAPREELREKNKRGEIKRKEEEQKKIKGRFW